MYVFKFLAIELQRLWGFVRTGNRLYNLLLHRLRWEGFKACHPSPGRERATVTDQPLTDRFSIAWVGIGWNLTSTWEAGQQKQNVQVHVCRRLPKKALDV